METVARGTDGRRLFTAEFKRQQVDRLMRGEVTASELSRELGVARALIQKWKYLATERRGLIPITTPVAAGDLEHVRAPAHGCLTK